MRWGTVAASDGAAEHRGAAAHHGGGQIGYWIAWLDLVCRESFWGPAIQAGGGVFYCLATTGLQVGIKPAA